MLPQTSTAAGVLAGLPSWFERDAQSSSRTAANYQDFGYLGLGDAWDTLSPAERTAANNHFLDVIAERGDRILTSVPKGEIPDTGTALSDEIAYLTGNKGYSWVNQWSLRPGG